MRTVAHVTHEAIQKFGGIGTVLEGLLTSAPYRQAGLRTILVGPLFPAPDGQHLGPTGEVLYSSLDHVSCRKVGKALDRVGLHYHTPIVYGRRSFTSPDNGTTARPEVLLIDVSRMNLQRVDEFKWQLWESFGIDSTRYESAWEYDMYVRLATPAIAALKALETIDDDNECVVVAHEFFGMPTALAAIRDPSPRFRSIFYAHEVATMRRIVEEQPGHDVSFYNALSAAIRRGQYLTDVFGPQDGYYRHALVQTARHCHTIFAVGEAAAKELRFMGPEFADTDIRTTYNGIPSERIDLTQRRASRECLQDYAQTLLGDRPDYVFTHVGRMATSKGFWRDLRVLAQLETMFRREGLSAVLFVLSTELPGRRSADIHTMERTWHWPVAHREKEPDLSWGEAIFYQGVQEFNARARQIKVVFVNQFGWERRVCGERMPEEMEFIDIRRGSDVEFGQSVYEPFGIAHLEPLTYGAICVPSSVCGCVGFIQTVSGAEPTPNIVVADYCDWGEEQREPKAWLKLTRRQRERHEAHVAAAVAGRIFKNLPRDEQTMRSLMDGGYELACRMSWDVVARDYILPGIDDVCRDKTAPKPA